MANCRCFHSQGLHVSNSRKESRTFKDAVIQGDDIPKISHIDSGINIDMHQFSNCLVNGSVDISLKIILGFGHNNKWEVKWARLLDEPNGQLVPPQTQSTVEAQPDNQPNNQKNQPNNKLLVSTDAVDLVAPVKAHIKPNKSKSIISWKSGPSKPISKPIFKWQPKTSKPTVAGPSGTKSFVESFAKSSSVNDESSEDDDTSIVYSNPPPLVSNSSNQVRDHLIAQVEVDNVLEKVWGNSKEWFLELRDGKRLRLPEGLRNLTPAVDDSISQRVLQWVEEQGPGGSVCTEEENTGWFRD